MEHKEKTVCIVINDLMRGGAQRIATDIALRSAVYGWRTEVVLFTQTKGPSFEKELSAAGISITTIEGEGFFSHVKNLFAHIRRTQPLVLCTMLPYASIIGRIVGFFTRTHVIGVQCNLPFAYPKRVRLLDWITSWMMGAWIGATDGIEIAYGGDRNRFSLELWNVGRRHFTLYGGVDVDLIAKEAATGSKGDLLRELDIPANAPLIMMTARLISWKGHADLIAALPLIPDAYLVLVGWGPLESDLRKQAAELGTQARVRFLGERLDVYRLLGSVDCYVQTHQQSENGIWIGPNLSQIEACAAGVPSVSTAVPLIEELIEEGVTGRLARINDPEDLARVIRECLANKTESERMAREAILRVQDRFSVDGMVRTYVALYEQIARA